MLFKLIFIFAAIQVKVICSQLTLTPKQRNMVLVQPNFQIKYERQLYESLWSSQCKRCYEQPGFYCQFQQNYCKSLCGDSIKTSDQQCDSKSPGCIDCKVAFGYACTGLNGQQSNCEKVETCGDGIKQEDQQCDNRNQVGCSVQCRVDENYSCIVNEERFSICLKEKYLSTTLVSSSFGLIFIGILIFLYFKFNTKISLKFNRSDASTLINVSTDLSTQICEEVQCTICLEDKCTAILGCKHWFHKQCIREWLNSKKTCPLCREPINVLHIAEKI